MSAVTCDNREVIEYALKNSQHSAISLSKILLIPMDRLMGDHPLSSADIRSLEKFRKILNK